MRQRPASTHPPAEWAADVVTSSSRDGPEARSDHPTPRARNGSRASGDYATSDEELVGFGTPDLLAGQASGSSFALPSRSRASSNVVSRASSFGSRSARAGGATASLNLKLDAALRCGLGGSGALGGRRACTEAEAEPLVAAAGTSGSSGPVEHASPGCCPQSLSFSLRSLSRGRPAAGSVASGAGAGAGAGCASTDGGERASSESAEEASAGAPFALPAGCLGPRAASDFGPGAAGKSREQGAGNRGSHLPPLSARADTIGECPPGRTSGSSSGEAISSALARLSGGSNGAAAAAAAKGGAHGTSPRARRPSHGLGLRGSAERTSGDGTRHHQGPEESLFANQTMRMHARLEGLSAAARVRDREAMFLLLENRSYGYPGTDGTLFSNYVAYCLNRHPLVSIICAHPLHPFTRPERFVILLCSFCFAYYLNSLMRFRAIRAQYWVVRYTILAVLIIPYEILIRVIAVCACVQYDDSEKGERKRRCFQASGHLTLFVVMCLNLLWITFGVLETIGAPVHGVSRVELGYSTVLIKVWSLFLWFPQWIGVFLLWYNHDKESWLQRHPDPTALNRCAAVSSRDADANPLYWLVLTGSTRPPHSARLAASMARVEERWSRRRQQEAGGEEEGEEEAEGGAGGGAGGRRRARRSSLRPPLPPPPPMPPLRPRPFSTAPVRWLPQLRVAALSEEQQELQRLDLEYARIDEELALAQQEARRRRRPGAQAVATAAAAAEGGSGAHSGGRRRQLAVAGAEEAGGRRSGSGRAERHGDGNGSGDGDGDGDGGRRGAAEGSASSSPASIVLHIPPLLAPAGGRRGEGEQAEAEEEEGACAAGGGHSAAAGGRGTAAAAAEVGAAKPPRPPQPASGEQSALAAVAAAAALQGAAAHTRLPAAPSVDALFASEATHPHPQPQPQQRWSDEQAEPPPSRADSARAAASAAGRTPAGEAADGQAGPLPAATDAAAASGCGGSRGVGAAAVATERGMAATPPATPRASSRADSGCASPVARAHTTPRTAGGGGGRAFAGSGRECSGGGWEGGAGGASGCADFNGIARAARRPEPYRERAASDAPCCASSALLAACASADNSPRPIGSSFGGGGSSGGGGSFGSGGSGGGSFGGGQRSRRAGAASVGQRGADGADGGSWRAAANQPAPILRRADARSEQPHGIGAAAAGMASCGHAARGLGLRSSAALHAGLEQSAAVLGGGVRALTTRQSALRTSLAAYELDLLHHRQQGGQQPREAPAHAHHAGREARETHTPHRSREGSQRPRGDSAREGAEPTAAVGSTGGAAVPPGRPPRPPALQLATAGAGALHASAGPADGGAGVEPRSPSPAASPDAFRRAGGFAAAAARSVARAAAAAAAATQPARLHSGSCCDDSSGAASPVEMRAGAPGHGAQQAAWRDEPPPRGDISSVGGRAEKRPALFRAPPPPGARAQQQAQLPSSPPPRAMCLADRLSASSLDGSCFTDLRAAPNAAATIPGADGGGGGGGASGFMRGLALLRPRMGSGTSAGVLSPVAHSPATSPIKGATRGGVAGAVIGRGRVRAHDEPPGYGSSTCE